MLYLLETPIGIALFKKDNDLVLLDKLMYKNPSVACDFIKSLNNECDFPEQIDNFFKQNLVNYSTLNILNPDAVSIFNSKYQINTICNPDKHFEKIRTNPFKWFEMNKNLYNAACIQLSHKLLNIEIVDSQIIETYKIVTEMEKNINNRMMRIREWYSLHFPELNYVTETVQYLNYIIIIGNKVNIIEKKDNEGSIISEHGDIAEIPDNIIDLAKNSMGIEMKEDDINKIKEVSRDILKDIEYKKYLTQFIKEKCMAHFPSLYNLIGEMLVAKLLNKAGSLSELSRLPSSTIQILGAEKSFNDAIKNHKNTPKYGMIFESKFISKSEPEIKGKVARILANKISLCARVDLEKNDGEFGKLCKLKISKMLEKFENQGKKVKKPIKQQKRKFISIKEYNEMKDSNKKTKINE